MTSTKKAPVLVVLQLSGGNDILNPLKIMKGMVDEVIFCEKYPSPMM